MHRGGGLSSILWTIGMHVHVCACLLSAPTSTPTLFLPATAGSGLQRTYKCTDLQATPLEGMAGKL